MTTKLKTILILGTFGITLFLNFPNPLEAKHSKNSSQTFERKDNNLTNSTSLWMNSISQFPSQANKNTSKNQNSTVENSQENRKCIDNFLEKGLSRQEAITWCGYKAECIIQSNNEGLSEDLSVELCDCTIDNFIAKYDLQEFKNLNKKAKNDEEAAEELSNIGLTCFEELLFEE